MPDKLSADELVRARAEALEELVLTADIDRVASAPENASSVTRPPASLRSAARKAKRPMRAVAVFGAVGALVAAMALPMFTTSAPVANADAPATLQQLAIDDAQSLVVASEVTAAPLEREAYSATSQAEIDKKRAEEAARKAAASRRASVAGSVNLNLVAPGSGAIRWPLTSFTYGPSNTYRNAARPNHNGFDMLAPARTPIFAVADGVVRVSGESVSGLGVAIKIDHNIGGQRVSTTYGHMTYGSRAVSAGQRVSAGQIIGLVGSTGNSNVNHLHLEVFINGSRVDPQRWLNANAG